jgi:hypothetical protein
MFGRLSAIAAAFILTASLNLLLLGYTEEPMLVPGRAFRVAFNLYGGFWGAVFAIVAMTVTSLLFMREKTSAIVFGLATAILVNLGLLFTGEWSVWRVIIVTVSVTFASAIAALLNVWTKYKKLVRKEQKSTSIKHDSTPDAIKVSDGPAYD